MADLLSIIIIGERASERAHLRSSLVSSGKVRVLEETEDSARLSELVRQLKPNGVLVILNGQASLDLISHVKADHPALPVIGASGGSPCTVDMVVKAQRAGATEFLMPPLSQADIEHVVERIQSADAPRKPLKSVIACYSCRGGAGVTTLCVNLAVTLAQTYDKPTTIVDLDLQQGTVPLLFGAHPEASMSDVIQSWARLDAKLLESFHTRLKSVSHNLSCLAAPAKVTDAYDVESWHIKGLMAKLREQFGFVVIDCQHLIDAVTVEALNQADTILLVTLPDLASVYTMRRTLEIFKQLEGFTYSDEKFHIVVNRYQKDSHLHLRLEKIKEMFGEKKVQWLLADDFKSTLAALHLGAPLVQSQPKSPLVRQYLDLARAITGQAVAPEQKKKERRGLFGWK
jgi:pilus assembly protein CpaE